MRYSRFILLLIAVHVFLAGAAYGGSIRYNLPELLGEHRYDGTTHIGGSAHINTPFGFYTVQQARLVIEGSVQPGKARGDGIIREALQFDLEPFVSIGASFKLWYEFPATPTIDSFSLDELHHYPFVPDTTPLPNPAGYPPISFSIGLVITLSFSTDIPPKIDLDSPFYDATDGIIVDLPIIANVTNAYAILSGPEIVPEPPAGFFAVIGCMSWLLSTAGRARDRPSLK
jgi:hypothetical protein